LHKHYELIIYTASLSKYADPLLDWLDPRNYCAYRLFREHCTYYQGIYVKDLSRLERDLKDTMVIDNSPTSYLFHPECAIPTNSWYDDLNDMELYQLCAILEKLSEVNDVRPYLAQFISNNKVNFGKAATVLGNEKSTDRSKTMNQASSFTSGKTSPITKNGPVKVQQQFTKDERNANLQMPDPQNDSRTTDERTQFIQKALMNTWSTNNKNTQDQTRTTQGVSPQYQMMGLNNTNSEMQKMLTNTLNLYNPGGRNYMKDSRRSSKNKSRQHSAAHKSNSKRRKSPSRGRNEANTIFLNLMKSSLKSSKSKHRKKKSSANVSRGRDSTLIHSVMPQTVSHINKTSIKKSGHKK